LFIRDVLVAPGCPRRFGAAATELDCTSSASSVLHPSSPLWEHGPLSSRSFIAPLSIQVHRCVTTPNLHSILSIREVRSQPGTVRVQEVSPGRATQRSQSSGCHTRSHPETSSLSLDSGVQNGRHSCERETPVCFVSPSSSYAGPALDLRGGVGIAVDVAQLRPVQPSQRVAHSVAQPTEPRVGAREGALHLGEHQGAVTLDQQSLDTVMERALHPQCILRRCWFRCWRGESASTSTPRFHSGRRGPPRSHLVLGCVCTRRRSAASSARGRPARRRQPSPLWPYRQELGH
jgi:hypothetical protein